MSPDKAEDGLKELQTLNAVGPGAKEGGYNGEHFKAQGDAHRGHGVHRCCLQHATLFWRHQWLGQAT